eukprot:1152183-Pelagomonas_calceolata.AAC.4
MEARKARAGSSKGFSRGAKQKQVARGARKSAHSPVLLLAALHRSGVDYCHQSGICHRDLKLENTLLDGSAVPKLKICDFGYSKSSQDSQPKSTVGTPAYIAPEVLMRKCYSGCVWTPALA